MSFLQSAGPMVLLLWGLSALGIYHLLREILWRLSPRRGKYSLSFKPVDAVEQLRLVMDGSFSSKRVMSKLEYRVFKAVEDEAASCSRGYRVFAQTSLGEILESKDRRTHSAINSKRVDILVIGYDGMPLLAVEHQGRGHHQGTAAARDAVKKEALRKAGVGYLEVYDDDPSEEIRGKVRSLLGRHVPA
jgi:hypothetical protein